MSGRLGMSRRSSGAVGTVVAVVLAVALWLVQGDGGESDPPASPASQSASANSTGGQSAPDDTDASSGGSTSDELPQIDESDLPPEAAETLRLIDAGGPFPYERDGVTFENREGILPDHDVGYYQEYTVETPGSDDRGARRIVTGDGGEFYWTEDHYESFSRINR